ncbi:unnamed protein product [Owenia fusiformis]|uniref:Uncharacterized protein n=1 Tax=Owenia fusiformis TaxID=6347 RepID=A0A8J1U407_OWEFU|nr:unnamed protein product [Owenia fusiformis]
MCLLVTSHYDTAAWKQITWQPTSHLSHLRNKWTFTFKKVGTGHTMNINLFDLNKVTFQQLSAIPGIDESFANAILKYRKQHKGVKHFDEIWKINGISRPKYKILQRHVEVVGQQPLVVGSKLPYAKESLETVHARAYRGFQKRRTELQKRAKSANGFVERQKLFTSTPKVARPSSYQQQRNKPTPIKNTKRQTKQAFVSPIAEPVVLSPSFTMSKRKTKTPEQNPYCIEASPSGNKLNVTCNLNYNKRNKDKASWMVFQVESGKGARRSGVEFESPVNEATSTTRVPYTHTQTQTSRHTLHEIAKSVQLTGVNRNTNQNIPNILSSARNGTPFEIHPPGLPSVGQPNAGNASQNREDNVIQSHIPIEVMNKDRDQLIDDTRNRLKNAKRDLRKIREVNSPRRLNERAIHEFEVQTYKTLGQKVRSIEKWIEEVEKETRGMYSDIQSLNNSNSNHSNERRSKSANPNLKSTNLDKTVDLQIGTNQCISCQQPMASHMNSPYEVHESYGQLRREDLTTTDHRAANEEKTRPMHKRKPQERKTDVRKDNDGETSPKSQKTARSPRGERGRREHRDDRESRNRHRQNTRQRPSHRPRRHDGSRKSRKEEVCKVM